MDDDIRAVRVAFVVNEPLLIAKTGGMRARQRQTKASSDLRKSSRLMGIRFAPHWLLECFGSVWFTDPNATVVASFNKGRSLRHFVRKGVLNLILGRSSVLGEALVGHGCRGGPNRHHVPAAALVSAIDWE